MSRLEEGTIAEETIVQSLVEQALVSFRSLHVDLHRGLTHFFHLWVTHAREPGTKFFDADVGKCRGQISMEKLARYA
ncbi:MAG: hypothetical protein JWQ21_991 [Herminiimonas sp.]|nr:hypothetical protein [Herminiimonas sp.]